MEFSLKEILEILMRRFILIAIGTFAGICVFFINSRFIVKPTYVASVQMYVNPNDSNYSADLNELNYAQKVVTTYINFLETKAFYNQVINESLLNYTEKQLKDMTDIKAINSTEIFEISVTTTNPNDSYILVNAMQKVAPILIKSIKETAQVSIIDPACLPTSPTGPNILRNTLAGGMIGFILSIVVSLLLELFDVNVKNQDELSKRYQLPILGAIPNFNLITKRKYVLLKKIYNDLLRKKVMQNNLVKNNLVKSNIVKNNLVKNKNIEFIITEAYKSLRSNLNFTLRHDGCKKFVITSPVPEDGKSTTITNIGISIAQSGAKVLLIDCDLRKGRLHRLFNVKFRPGLSDALSSTMDVKNVIYKTTYQNLSIMPMGTIPPNPSELLASIQMEELLNKINSEYEYIIIDTPPVEVVSDALNLVKMVDGVLIVVREGVTSHPCISNTLSKYQFLNANILGFVLNGIALNQEKKSKYQYYN